MRILFAIQGTGNGHLSRARDIYAELEKYAEVDVLISGTQSDIDFPFPVQYRLYGLSFIFGKHGGVDMWQTAKKMRLFRLIRDIRRLPVKMYDLVISDFEPVSAWACRLRGMQCIGLSHQSAVLHPSSPRPETTDRLGKWVLRHYAPVTSFYGLHFRNYGKGIYTPVIRTEVRDLVSTDEGHYTVYLPAYDDNSLIKHLSFFSSVKWQVFSKHNKESFDFQNISVRPIDKRDFLGSLASCRGVLCGAGFEGPAEALFLGKKLMVIPMRAQYEQQCNAAALREINVPVIPYLGRRYYDRIYRWLLNAKPVKIEYPDITSEVVATLMKDMITDSAVVPARVDVEAVSLASG